MASSDASGVCPGGLNSVTLTAAGSTNGTYSWTANGVTLANQTGTLVVSPTVATTYTVTATTSCGTSSQQILVPVKDVTITPSAPVICAGQTTVLTASYSGSSATYQWYEKGTTTVLSSTNSVSVKPTVTKTYQVVATTTDCRTITKEVTVTVGAPTVSVAPSAVTICSGGSTTLNATSNNPNATYSWSPATGLSAANTATVIASPTATTTYTVTVTACNATATQTVRVNVTAAIFTDPSPATTCSGTPTTLTAGSNITDATYAWYRTTDLGTTLSTTSTLTVAPTATTTYKVVISTPTCGSNSTNGSNGQDATVTVNPAPTVGVTASSTSIVSGTATILTASGAATYSWSPATGLSSTSGPTVTAKPTATTTYTVTGTAAGCSSSKQITITVRQALPVKLVRFEAAWAGNGPLLHWATASEENSDYFEVQRSLDGESFTALGQVNGQGTTATATAYAYHDATLSAKTGTLYYRLRQVDHDGTAAYSPVRTLAAGGAIAGLTLYPNPAQGATTLAGAQVGASVQVLNALGQVVLTTAANAAGTAELVLPAGLRGGIYLVRSCGHTVRLTVGQ